MQWNIYYKLIFFRHNKAISIIEVSTLPSSLYSKSQIRLCNMDISYLKMYFNIPALKQREHGYIQFIAQYI